MLLSSTSEPSSMMEQGTTPSTASRLIVGPTQSSAQASATGFLSDRPLAAEEPFSLEKTLRAVLDKYARHSTIY